MKILIVDDDRDFAEMLAEVLENLGHESHVAFRGAEAVKRVEKEPFDLVLMDLRMPGMNGLEALSEVRARRPELPVVMTTGHGLEHLLREVAGVRAAAVLPWPRNDAELDDLLSLKLAVIGGQGGTPEELVAALARRGVRATIVRDTSQLGGNAIGDVLLLDLHRPLIDGVLCYLCSAKLGHDRPMWLFVDRSLAAGRPGDPLRSLAVTGCLFKPFAIAELQAVLAAAAGSPPRVAPAAEPLPAP